MKIEEIIVVEGKSDTKRIQEVLDADTIETIGSAINETILAQIELAQKQRGVIVLTDPDFSGEKIRKIIMARVPEAKHAFLPRKAAQAKKKGQSLGVEHASDAAILAALQAVMTPAQPMEAVAEIPRQVLLDYGLIAGKDAKKRREKLGELLQIGYTNSKQLVKRLAMFRITAEALAEAMKKVEESF